MKTENELAEIVIRAAFNIHTQLGPGLLESVYKECLVYELSQQGIKCEQEKAVPVYYKENKLEVGFRIDILVENKLVLEIKSVEAIHDVHRAQTLTYLKFGEYKLGLLLNFHTTKMKDGIKRIVNGL